MKKLLGLLGSMALIASTGITVVACGDLNIDTTNPEEGKDINDIIKKYRSVLDQNIKKFIQGGPIETNDLQSKIESIDKGEATTRVQTISVVQKDPKSKTANIKINLMDNHYKVDSSLLSFSVENAVKFDVTDGIKNFINDITNNLTKTPVFEKDLQNAVDSVKPSDDLKPAIAKDGVKAIAKADDEGTADITISLNGSYQVVAPILEFSVDNAIKKNDVTQKIKTFQGEIKTALGSDRAADEQELQDKVDNIVKIESDEEIKLAIKDIKVKVKDDKTTASITIDLNVNFKSDTSFLKFDVPNAIEPNKTDVTDGIKNFIKDITDNLTTTPVYQKDLKNAVDSVNQSDDLKTAIKDVAEEANENEKGTAIITITLKDNFKVQSGTDLTFSVKGAIKQRNVAEPLTDYVKAINDALKPAVESLDALQKKLAGVNRGDDLKIAIKSVVGSKNGTTPTTADIVITLNVNFYSKIQKLLTFSVENAIKINNNLSNNK